MCNAPKYTLLAMLALAASALAAPSGFAQTEPELHPQAPRLVVAQEIHAANDVGCPVVTPTPPPAVSPTFTSGGCRLHLVSSGQVQITSHSAGGIESLISACTIEYDVRVDSAGEGWVSHQEFFGVGAGCTRGACAQPSPTDEGRAYTFHMSEAEPPAQTERATILFCHQLIGGGPIEHCEITFAFSETSIHRYSFTANGAPGHGGTAPRCEMSGTFAVEASLGSSGEAQAEQNVEIRHT